MNLRKNGFAYIAAVLILGLLSFMGLFLMQSSSEEYSQAAMSVYSTITQQIAEAAADECFLALEEQFRDPSNLGKMGPLLRQGREAKFFPEKTGLNPSLLDILPDFAPYVTQTNYLISHHITRANFFIESIKASIMDFRPIDYRPINLPSCIYRPKDRQNPYWSSMSNDFQLSLGITVIAGYKVGRRKHKVKYQVTRDIKIINVGPIARNYTLFSIFGPDLRNIQDEILNDFQKGNGRLVLWNHPYQSRVYLHGPAVIGIENPDYDPSLPERFQWAFTKKDPNGRPGINHAFQYSITYNGLSYIPFPARALWEPKKIFGGSVAGLDFINDLQDMTEAEKLAFKNNTYIRGFIPRGDREIWSQVNEFLSSFGDANTKDYLRGRRVKQLFLPAGPFCRFPWRYVPDRVPSYFEPNRIAESWPNPDPHIRIEHRWVPGDDSYDKETKIYAELLHFKIIKGFELMQVGYPQLRYPEFSLCYGNHRDPETIGEKFIEIFSSLARSCWYVVTTPARWTLTGLESVYRSIVKPRDPTIPGGIDERNHINLYPTNFKDFNLATTLRLKSVRDIPKDPQDGKTWILDGVYSLDSFITDEDVLYRGKGIIYVGIYNPNASPDGNFVIRGNILKAPNYRDSSHLTLVYYPRSIDSQTGEFGGWPDFDRAQIVIDGHGKVIEASVFSLAGIRTRSGIISDEELISLGLNPAETTKKWMTNFKAPQLAQLQSKVNMIVGNYVTYFVKKSRLDGDLWIMHDILSPFYAKKDQSGVYIIKEDLDESDELLMHTVHLSPKIQHMYISGASDE